jgi:hypothetical protein
MFEISLSIEISFDRQTIVDIFFNQIGSILN